MTITFYNNSSLDNVLDKNLTTLATVTGTFNTDFDKGQPTIKVTYTDTLKNANYALIDGAYYFLSNPTIMPNGIITWNTKKDVLKTYSTKIKNVTAYIQRSNIAENYIQNSIDTLSAKTETVVNTYNEIFSQEETDGMYFLCVSQNGYNKVT